jgi:hypothetical protein
MSQKKKPKQTLSSQQFVPKEEPFFINFVNTKDITKEYLEAVLKKVEDLFADAADKKTAMERREALKDHHIEGFRLVQTKLRDHLDYITEHGKFDKAFPAWANFYLSSLKEYKTENNNGIERFVRIGDPNGDWVNGIILYNFSLFCKTYGLEILKKCPVDGVFFSVKGKYAKYCSEKCKRVGQSNKEDELNT